MSPLKDTNHLKNKPQRVARTVFAQSCGSYKNSAGKSDKQESIYSGVKENVAVSEQPNSN